MQLNLDRIQNNAAGQRRWQRLATHRASSLASLRGIRPATIPLEALSPFARCDGGLPPAKLLAELRTVLATVRSAIRADFALRGDGLRAARRHGDLIDALVRHLLEIADRAVPAGAPNPLARPLAVAAVGGYGRAELAPHSDIDLLFLVPEQPSVHCVHAIEFVLYRLWDLGLQVGHAVRSVGECVSLARSDRRTATSLLDLRFLWGRRALYAELTDRFRSEIASDGEALVDALRCDLAKRHARSSDPAAPDVKRGRGGLRDLQTLLWLRKIRGQRRHAANVVDLALVKPSESCGHADALRFLWSVRCHLHYLTGRAEERLSAHLQPEIARRMLSDEPPERRSAAALMREFRQATTQVENSCMRLLRQ